MGDRHYVFYYYRRDNPCEKVFFNTEVTSEPRGSSSWKKLETLKKNNSDISGIECSSLGPEGLTSEYLKDMLYEV